MLLFKIANSGTTIIPKKGSIICMKNKFNVRVCSFIVFFSFINYFLQAQCDISFCNNPTLNADMPVYNAGNNSIDINNLTFGNVGCSLTNKQFGIDVYVYHILPNNSKANLCDVLDVAPENIAGYVRLDLGSNNICNNTFNLGTISLDSSNGFNICDGITYEIEIILFATDNTSFKTTNKTVFSELPTSEYISTNLGQIDININNIFPGNAQPLLISEISDWATRTNGGISVPCNSDVEFYLQGQSLLGNCFPYNDFTVAITSELVNVFTYSINGATPVVIENSSTGASGGQNTGPIQNSNDCYGGILTNVQPFVFEANSIANPCNTSVEFKLVTFDVFTNQTEESTFILSYSNNCVNNLTLNNTTLASNTYSAGQTITTNANLSNNATVSFIAAKEVTLNSNFTANTTNDFLVDIGPCQ